MRTCFKYSVVGVADVASAAGVVGAVCAARGAGTQAVRAANTAAFNKKLIKYFCFVLIIEMRIIRPATQLTQTLKLERLKTAFSVCRPRKRPSYPRNIYLVKNTTNQKSKSKI